MRPRRLPLLALLACLAPPAGALDLVGVWEAARKHDPQGAIIESDVAAGAARRQQADALWRPEVGLTATAGIARAETRTGGAQFSAPGFGTANGTAFATSIDSGLLTRWSVAARQPLFNAERSAQRRQLKLSAEAADLQALAARQDWMLHLGQRYFDLVAAEARLALVRRQAAAVDQALAEARDRFALGDAPVTDTHEAQARARALQAQQVALASDVEVVRAQLADLTGLAPATVVVQPPLRIPGPPGPLEDTLAGARKASPLLRLQQAQVDTAEQEVEKYRSGGGATVDLVAQAGRELLHGSGDYGGGGANLQSQRMVGVTLSVPLSTGGWRDARLEESRRLAEKSRATLEQLRLAVAQQVRATWHQLQSGRERMAALEDGLAASRSRLEATRLGRGVGDRTTLDLLNAENDAQAAELAVLQGRIDLLLGRLRLDALAGQLDLERLRAVNAALQP